MWLVWLLLTALITLTTLSYVDLISTGIGDLWWADHPSIYPVNSADSA